MASKSAHLAGQEGGSYLGQKGYTIYKESLGAAECKQLREELTVRPYIPKSPIQPPSFPVYRECKQKMYIPRCFGIDTYGAPDAVRLTRGANINVPFEGDLRDYQNNVVDIFMKSALKKDDSGKELGGGGLLEIPCGRGKTVIALKIISSLKKKALVLVHKGFLMSQWIERIGQFLPNARVGKIQGQIIDIEDKDIVLGMIQSLSMKEYPEELFASFGLTIVDECHHIASEVFCRSLQKIMTFYCLGLSATMERKDGLTRVFKMFLGEIIYNEKRESNDPVLVKGIQYMTKDEEFNEMVYDYRGNPAYSTMISKLCSFGPRSEFILKVLANELKDSSCPKQQIMILAHNKNLLVYLHDAIAHRQLARVGYYVGGMKEADLKRTEDCQVIIATFAMAAEALDIKTLTTLILATPKTDIVQAVGRILRVKHERPLVIDIIDSHDVFVKQWLKRRKYYVDNKYKVIQTNSDQYDKGVWRTYVKGGDKKRRKVNTAAEGSDSDGEDGDGDGNGEAQKNSDGIPKGKCLIQM